MIDEEEYFRQHYNTPPDGCRGIINGLLIVAALAAITFLIFK